MITEQQYKDALKLVNDFRKQSHKLPAYAIKSSLYPEYYISKRGEIWNSKGCKLSIVTKANKKTGRKQLRVSVNSKTIGLATIIAAEFVPKPNGYNNVHFKDNDPTNCTAENLCWLNNELKYLSTKINHPERSPMGKGRKKIVGDAKESAAKVKCEFLQKYYLSGNEKYLKQCWENIDSQMTMKGWNEVQSECYIYFMDRTKRKSLTGNPIAYIIVMATRVYKGMFKTLNTSKAKESRMLDESLVTQKY
jgi:hypothetical protein